MLNFLNFSFNYIDIVCFFAVYFLLATYFGNKLLYSSGMKYIEYIYSIICILAITICSNPLSSSQTRLTGTNQIMLMLMLITFLILTIKAVFIPQHTRTLNHNNDGLYDNVYNKTFEIPSPRQATYSFNQTTEQTYENIYSATQTENIMNTDNNVAQHTEQETQQNKENKETTSLDTTQEHKQEDIRAQLYNLQQQANIANSNVDSQQQSTDSGINTNQQINIIEDKIILLADKIHNMEKQIINKQQQEIDDIRNTLSQQGGSNDNQMLQAEQMTETLISKRQEPIMQQLHELTDKVCYLENALQRTVDRIAKVFALFKKIIRNANEPNYE